MDDLARAHYASAYALIYFGALAAMALWEAAAPRRVLGASLRLRWSGNFAVALLHSALAWWAFPMASIGFAALAAERGWGALRVADAPYPLAFAVSILLLDLSRYGQHWLLHRVKLLWRVHRMHHTDQDFDFTTALRFHPLEALVTAAVTFVLVAGLGAPIAAVALYELVFVAMVMFNHGNVKLLGGIEAALRLVLVTPDMHRIHHSARRVESDSNLGGVLSLWDRLFGTYLAQPEAGHQGMTIGLGAYRGREHLMLHRMLVDPFVGGLPADDPAARTDALVRPS